MRRQKASPLDKAWLIMSFVVTLLVIGGGFLLVALNSDHEVKCWAMALVAGVIGYWVR